LLLKSAFERIFNVMQLILGKKLSDIKWKYLIQKNSSHDMKQTDSSIIIVRNVYLLTSASMIVYLFVTRLWSAIIGTKQRCLFHVVWTIFSWCNYSDVVHTEYIFTCIRHFFHQLNNAQWRGR
jgi:hypothetical protein